MNQATNAAASVPFPPVPTVIFAHWRELLNKSAPPEAVRSGNIVVVSGYLAYCRDNGLSVTVESARAYMDDVQPD